VTSLAEYFTQSQGHHLDITAGSQPSDSFLLGGSGELFVPPPPLVGQFRETFLIGSEPSAPLPPPPGSLPLVDGSEPSATPVQPLVGGDEVPVARSGGPIFQLGTPQSGGSLGRHTDSNTSSYNDGHVGGRGLGDDEGGSDVVLRQKDGWPPAALGRRIHELEQQLDQEKEQRQQLTTANQQLATENEQLRQLTLTNQQLAAENEQLQLLSAANQQLVAEKEQLEQRVIELSGQQQSSSQLIAYEQELKTKKNTIELLVTEKTELESKVVNSK
jgi:hypothetical protein